MKRVARAIADLASDIAASTAAIGKRVVVDELEVTDRGPYLDLRPAGIWSPNRSCRLVRTADGWIAANLARDSDRALVPAWIGCGMEAAPWKAIVRVAPIRPWRELVASARLLGLPVCGLGETSSATYASIHPIGRPRDKPPGRRLDVIDLTSLWAGPLCGALLAGAGANVTKVESIRRVDTLRTAAPAFFARLNGAKSQAAIDFEDPADLARLEALAAAADILITSARPRAFEQLGLTPDSLFRQNPHLTWIAITGYGWFGPEADRVAFGDDAAVAGGLVRWTAAGAPRFMGDALADPLTGLAAAARGMEAVLSGGGVLVDVAMARVSSAVASA